MSTTSTDPIRVGIAGLGRAGWELHANVLAALPDTYRVAAVCEPLEARRAEAQTRFNCRAYTDFDSLARDVDVELIVIAMPSRLHADLAITAMRNGKHVLVEKPFATDLHSADQMIAVAHETERILTGSQNLRYEGDFLKVREVIESGKLGRIVQIRIAWHWFRRRWDWQTLRAFGGGSLNNDGSHVIDQALLLLGDAEPEVFCHMDRTPLSLGDAEDFVKILLRAPGQPLVDLEFSNACAYPQDQWLVMGTQGGLTGSHHTFRWRYIEPGLLPARAVSTEPTPDRSYNREEFLWVEETSDFSGETYTTSHKRLYHDLYATVRQGAPLAITPESIRRQLAVLEQCRAVAPDWDEHEAAP